MMTVQIVPQDECDALLEKQLQARRWLVYKASPIARRRNHTLRRLYQARQFLANEQKAAT